MQVTRDLFDMNWQPIDEIVVMGNEKPGSGMLKKPVCFDQMVSIAQTLSADFKFVRVDLYELDGRIYFGELTFTPAHCVFPHFTEKFNREMGKLLHI